MTLNTLIFIAQSLMLQCDVSVLPSCFNCISVQVSDYEVAHFKMCAGFCTVVEIT